MRLTVTTCVVLITGCASKDPRPIGPRVLCEESLFIQNASLNSLHELEIVAENAGGSPLEIRDIGASCTCTKLRATVGGTPVSLQRIALEPGQSVRISVSLRVTVRSTKDSQSTIRFSTSDLARPDVKVDIFVKDILESCTFEPRVVQVGEIMVGQHGQELVRVSDHSAREKRTILRLESSNPRIVSAKMIAGPSTKTRDIGSFEVDVCANEDGLINERVTIHYADPRAPSDSVSVVGHATRHLRVVPSKLRLSLSEVVKATHGKVPFWINFAGKVTAPPRANVPSHLRIDFGPPDGGTIFAELSVADVTSKVRGHSCTIPITVALNNTQHTVNLTVTLDE